MNFKFERARSFRHIGCLVVFILQWIIALTYGASWEGYESKEQAQTAVESAASRIKAAKGAVENALRAERNARTQVSRLSMTPPGIREIDSQILDMQAKLRSLLAEKEAALAEMREGLFCSGCGQTKSQILAKGEEFPHEGQTIIQATQEQLIAKATEFDGKAQTIRDQIFSLNKQRDTMITEWKASVFDAENRLKKASDDVTAARREQQRAENDLSKAQMAITMLGWMKVQDDWTKLTEERLRLAQERQLQQQARLREEQTARQRIWEQENSLARTQWNTAVSQQAQRTTDAETKRATTPVETAPRIKEEEFPRLKDVEQQNARANETPPVMPKETQSLDITPDKIEERSPYSSAALKQRIATLADSSNSPSGTGIFSELNKQKSQDTWLQRISDEIDEAKRTVKNFKASQATDLTLNALKSASDKVFEKALDYGPATLTDTVSETFHSAMDELSGRNRDASSGSTGLLSSARIQIIDKITETAQRYAAEATREKIVDAIHDAMFGKESSMGATGDDELDKAQREFEVTVSPGNLFYRTLPLVGGRAISGLKTYLEESNEKFWNYFSLATDRIMDVPELRQEQKK